MQPGLVLESHLTNVEVVAVYALSTGHVNDSLDRVRSGTEQRFLLTRGKAESALAALWQEDQVFLVRMIPALRFDSRHGCIVVADVRGAGEFRSFTGKRGQRYLQSTTPLLTVADAAEREGGSDIWIAVAQRGDTEILAPRRPPRSWLVYSPTDPWVDEENTHPTGHVRAVVRNFHAVNLTENG